MPLDLSRPSALLGGVRRQVLRRRRLLAVVLTAVAVGSGLAAARQAPPASVPVVVATRDLPAGEVLGADDLATVAFAPGSVPSGLAADVADDVSGRVLATPLTRGAPLTEVALVGPAMTGARTDLRAVPVRLPDAGAVGLLRVGDEIDLVATDPQSGGSETVAPAAVVLAVPAPDESTGPTGLAGRLVVLGVREGELGELAAAASRALVTYAWSAR